MQELCFCKYKKKKTAYLRNESQKTHRQRPNNEVENNFVCYRNSRCEFFFERELKYFCVHCKQILLHPHMCNECYKPLYFYKYRKKSIEEIWKFKL